MIPVKEVMTTNVITFREDTPVEEIALTLSSKRITGGPVIGPDGHVVGIVSEVDVFSKRGKVARDIMSRDRRGRTSACWREDSPCARDQARKDGGAAEPLRCARFLCHHTLDLQRLRSLGTGPGAARTMLLLLQHRHPIGARRSGPLIVLLAFR
jgi:CBS domain-containing protein